MTLVAGEFSYRASQWSFVILYVLKYCKGIITAACRSFDVQACEGESDLVALRYTEVPLLQEVGRVRLGILGRLDLPIHYRLRVGQRPAFTH